MSKIDTYLNYIKTRIWAGDVREAIVNAISQCYSDVSSPTLQTEALEMALQNKIDAGEMAELVIGDGTIEKPKLSQDLLRELLGNNSIVFNTFSVGKQIQRYHIGQVAYINDATQNRAINETPIFFPQKTYVTAVTGYLFFATFVTNERDFTVIGNTESEDGYVNSKWIGAGTYAFLQIKKEDNSNISSEDLTVINNWINFTEKTFDINERKRVCASKKQYYTGVGKYYANNHYSFTIAHLTDIHADVKRYQNFRKFVDDNSDVIDCAILTGDYVEKQNDNQWDAMNNVDGVIPILQVVGNHDAGHQAGDTLLDDEELVEKFGVTTNTGKMYYYVDYNNNIRLIILNQFEGTKKGTYVYSLAEIEWLLGALDDSITGGKHVIIACHIPDTFPVANDKGFYQRYNRWSTDPKMNSGIEEVIDAYRKGANVTKTLSNDISINHTFSGQGDFICWICGHFHGDYIGYSEEYPDQLYLLGNCGVCQALPFKTTFMGETNSDLARIPGTPTEDCFNVYSFNLNEGIVNVVRIGANTNDLLKERISASYKIDGEIDMNQAGNSAD